MIFSEEIHWAEQVNFGREKGTVMNPSFIVRVIYDDVGGSSRQAHLSALKAIRYFQHDSDEVIRYLDEKISDGEGD